MKRMAIPGLLFLALALDPASGLAGSGDSPGGTVTYVSGEVYYISLGSKEGMEDSLLVAVVAGGDTVATLKIFAVSSKSSACTMVSGKRAPRVGDAVGIPAMPAPPAIAGTDSTVPGTAVEPGPGLSAESVSPTRAAPANRRESQTPPAFRIGGRMTAQYQTYLMDASPGSITQPSVSLSMRGEARDRPVKFEFVGSLRISVTGASAPFAGSSVNRSRVYRLYLEYNDGDNRFGAGRLLPSAGLPAGYIDGLVLGRRIGPLEFGVAAGYEPDFTQRSFSADRKKVMVYAGTGNAGGAGWSLNAGFAKTFLHSSPERSVASASAFFAPSTIFSFNAQTEVDFLNMKNSRAVTRPKLSSLLATMNYRIAGALTLGAGVTAWRPVYPLSFLAGIEDSLVDSRLWVSPTVSLRIATVGGVSLQESYSPRSTPEGFGREYFNNLTIGFTDVLGSGVGVRASQTINRSSIASTTGYGASLRRTVWTTVDAGLGYRYYRAVFDREQDPSSTRSLTADLSFPLGPVLFFMASGEFSHSTAGDYRLFSGSVSWRF
jgi:hypothetical protein